MQLMPINVYMRRNTNSISMVMIANSDETAYLLADCYYKTQQYQRARWLLTTHHCKSAKSRYLLASCYFKLEE